MSSEDEKKYSIKIKEEVQDEESSTSGSEDDSNDESDMFDDTNISIDYEQDEAILGDDYDLPSTSNRSNVLSMKTAKNNFKKPKKKTRRRRKTKGTKRRKVSRKKTKRKRRTKKRKVRRTKGSSDDLAKRLRLRWAQKARELTTRERIIETCGIDTKNTNQYKIVMKSRLSGGNTSRVMTNVHPEKLDLLGAATFGLEPSVENENEKEVEGNENASQLGSQKEEKSSEIPQSSLDLLDKILEDQNRTFPISRTKKSQHERITENETTSETKIAEREILSRHERRKRLREDLKKHTKLEHRLKHFMNDPQNEPDTSVKQIQIEEKSEMETMPMTSRGVDMSLPDPISKPPRKTRWQQTNSSIPSNNFNNTNQEIFRNDSNPNPIVSNNSVFLPGILGSIPSQIHTLQLPPTTSHVNSAPSFTLPQASTNAVLDLLRNASLLPSSMNLITAHLNPQGNAATDLLSLYRQQMQAQLNPLLLQAQLLQQPPMPSLPMPSLIIPQQLTQQPPSMHLPPPPPPPLNMFNQQQQQHQQNIIRSHEMNRLPDHSLPHIPLPSSSPHTSGVLEPCPPQSDSRSSGSPMDIDMEIGDESHPHASQPTTSKHSSTSNPKDQKKKHKDSRLNDAVTAMKNALKPYYRDKIISKNDYKEIMKKGVDKLVHTKNETLEQKKVDKFAKKYVDLVVHTRKKESKPQPTSS